MSRLLDNFKLIPIDRSSSFCVLEQRALGLVGETVTVCKVRALVQHDRVNVEWRRFVMCLTTWIFGVSSGAELVFPGESFVIAELLVRICMVELLIDSSARESFVVVLEIFALKQHVVIAWYAVNTEKKHVKSTYGHVAAAREPCRTLCLR